MTRHALAQYFGHARLFSRNARLFLLANGLAGLGVGISMVLLNLYLLRLGFREDFIGQVAGLTTLATGVISIPAGILADRFGRRRTILLGTALCVVASAGQVTLPYGQAILALSAGVGVGYGLVYTCTSPLLTENSTPRERTHLFSWNFALTTIAAVMGNLLGGALPVAFAHVLVQSVERDATPYRLALLAGVATYLCAIVPVYLMGDAPITGQGAQVQADEGRAPERLVRTVLALSLVSVTVGMGAGLIIPFFNVYFRTEFGLPTQSVGLIFAVSQGLIAGGSLLGPALAARMGKVVSTGIGQVSGVPFLLLLAVTTDVRVATLAFWGRAVGINVTQPIYSAFVMEMVPARWRATVWGVTGTVWDGAWAVSSTLGGILIVSLGYQSVFSIAAWLYLASGLAFLFFFWRYRRM